MEPPQKSSQDAGQSRRRRRMRTVLAAAAAGDLNARVTDSHASVEAAAAAAPLTRPRHRAAGKL